MYLSCDISEMGHNCHESPRRQPENGPHFKPQDKWVSSRPLTYLSMTASNICINRCTVAILVSQLPLERKK